jgi:hypothetical protein
LLQVAAILLLVLLQLKELMRVFAMRAPTLMQLLFSLDCGMRVAKTLMQTLASHQLSSSFDQGLKISGL